MYHLENIKTSTRQAIFGIEVENNSLLNYWDILVLQIAKLSENAALWLLICCSVSVSLAQFIQPPAAFKADI